MSSRVICVSRSTTNASPKLLAMKAIRLPSGDHEARSPKPVSWVMSGGRCSSGAPCLNVCACATPEARRGTHRRPRARGSSSRHPFLSTTAIVQREMHASFPPRRGSRSTTPASCGRRDGHRGRRHHAVQLRAQVVGVDLLPHGDEALAIDQPDRTERRHRFSERDRRAPVQDAERLAGALITGIVATTRGGVSSRISMPSVFGRPVTSTA